MNRYEKHSNHIINKLQGTYSEIKIAKISKMPAGVKYITWSIGWQLQTGYSYKVNCTDESGQKSTIYTHIITFLSLTTLKTLFFLQTDKEYSRLYPENNNESI